MKRFAVLFFIAACASRKEKVAAPAPAPTSTATSSSREAVDPKWAEELKKLAVVHENYPSWVLSTILNSKGYYRADDVTLLMTKAANKPNPKKYFMFKAPECCDILTPVYDEKGQEVCKIGAGFAGREDPKCRQLVDSLQAVDFQAR